MGFGLLTNSLHRSEKMQQKREFGATVWNRSREESGEWFSPSEWFVQLVRWFVDAVP
jgi:hypothetical protein